MLEFFRRIFGCFHDAFADCPETGIMDMKPHVLELEDGVEDIQTTVDIDLVENAKKQKRRI